MDEYRIKKNTRKKTTEQFKGVIYKYKKWLWRE